MRIEGNARVSGTAARAGARGAAGPDFVLPGAAGPSGATATTATSSISGIEALLALQAVGDPLERRRRAVRRGTDLLDQLEGIKGDLLVGRLDPSRLDAMLATLSAARQRDEPGLDAVLDDIELRVRVELAKFGRFPAL